ncbi:MAG TPA: potassium channel family protein [Amycolatopsis sp.]|nr:potassium channel family protein [Amycolatopsis sp.]
MADTTPPPPTPRELGRVRRGRFLLLAVIRPMVTIAVQIVAYYLLPVDQRMSAVTVVELAIGFVVVVALVVWEVRVIVRSPYPALQGVQALAIIIPLFLLIFAYTYYIVEHNIPNSFTTPLTRTDSLYFVVTVFATVGFGDITAVTQVARVLVIIQMVGDLLVLGVVLRVVVSAVQRGRARPPPQTP